MRSLAHNYVADYAAFSHGRDDPAMQAAIRRDFCGSLSLCLDSSASAPASTSQAIAASLYERMHDRGLYYHTPLHILSLLSFAEAEGIALEPWEQLVVWFHDAVYLPTAKPMANERNSALYMRAMLSGVVDEALLDRTQAGIEATGRHLDGDVDATHGRLLDLDVCNFSWARPNYEASSADVAREYAAVHGQAAWEAGRRQFLTSLLARGYLYRTTLFHERFEAAARENLGRDGITACSQPMPLR